MEEEVFVIQPGNTATFPKCEWRKAFITQLFFHKVGKCFYFGQVEKAALKSKSLSTKPPGVKDNLWLASIMVTEGDGSIFTHTITYDDSYGNRHMYWASKKAAREGVQETILKLRKGYPLEKDSEAFVLNVDDHALSEVKNDPIYTKDAHSRWYQNVSSPESGETETRIV